MFSLIKSHPKAVLWAVIVHIFFLLMMGVSFHFIDAPSSIAPEVKVVNAVLKDDSLTEQKRKKKLEQQRKLAEKKRQKALRIKKEKQRKLALKRQAELKKKKLAKIAAEKKRQQEQADKLKAEQALKEQIEKENRRLEQERERQLREAKLKKEMAEEQARLAAEREARNKTIIEKQLGIIKAHIEQRWIKPASTKVGMVCVISVNLIPSGEVINVRYVRRSGNAAFDQSVFAAVKRASPLPLPAVEYGLSDRFREITLNFGKQK